MGLELFIALMALLIFGLFISSEEEKADEEAIKRYLDYVIEGVKDVKNER